MLALTERLDFNVRTCGQIELHQSIDCLLRGLENVEQTLVRRISNCSRDFLSTCGDRRTVVREVDVGSEWGPLLWPPSVAVSDFRCRLIQHPMIVCLQPDANSIF